MKNRIMPLSPCFWHRAALVLLLTVGAKTHADESAAGAEKWGLVPAETVARLDIGVATVTVKPLARNIDVVGTVEFDQDRVAIAGPRLAGRIVQLHVRPGDVVRRGDMLAELESVELARTAARYLAQKARSRAAAANAARERELHRRQVSSAREREAAIAEEEALQAQVVAAEQLLLALGLSKDELPNGAPQRPLSRFAVRAPIDGVLVERSVVLGEAIDAGETIARIADMSRVWVNLDVFERDLAWMRPGLEAVLRVDAFPDLQPAAHVRYIRPEIDPETRTAMVQLDVDNPDGRLRPGQFVTARLKSDGGGPDTLAIPRDALQLIEGKEVVFVRGKDGSFSVRNVTVGTRGTDDIEILSGVNAGESVAVVNAFLLKSEVLR